MQVTRFHFVCVRKQIQPDLLAGHYRKQKEDPLRMGSDTKRLRLERLIQLLKKEAT